jgi:hypothetical protein
VPLFLLGVLTPVKLDNQLPTDPRNKDQRGAVGGI